MIVDGAVDGAFQRPDAIQQLVTGERVSLVAVEKVEQRVLLREQRDAGAFIGNGPSVRLKVQMGHKKTPLSETIIPRRVFSG